MNSQSSLTTIKKRQSNIELLRIIAMILIIAHHFSVHGGFAFSTSSVTVNRVWVQVLQFGGKIGVNIFVLISGYFLISAKKIKISKILKLWLQIFTYSIVIYSIFVLTGLKHFNFEDAFSNLLPITYTHWWFAATYFVLYLICPYLNRLLLSLEKKDYQKLLTLTTICWCILPTILKTDFQSSNLIWFMYVYAVAGYIRRFINIRKINVKKCIIAVFVITAITLLITVALDFIGIKYEEAANRSTDLFELQKLPIVLISILLFVGFLNINIGYSKKINIIAKTTFGIYLIHDDKYLSGYLWKKVFKNASFSASSYLIPYSLLVILIIFCVGSIIELLRIKLLEKYYMKHVERFSTKIEKVLDNFFNLKLFKWL